MTSYTLERMDYPDAYLVTLKENFDIANDLDALNKDLVGHFDQDQAPSLVLIADIREFGLSLGSIMAGGKTTNDTGINPNQHPKIKRTIVISNHRILNLSLDGLYKFGLFKDTRVADSMEQAIALASAD